MATRLRMPPSPPIASAAGNFLCGDRIPLFFQRQFAPRHVIGEGDELIFHIAGSCVHGKRPSTISATSQ
ncbi:MAG: hypothetical protein LBI69_00930 [Puniceicoccales bacterium]|nr:hypothetical protein [Puniceicoccales bacterium]